MACSLLGRTLGLTRVAAQLYQGAAFAQHGVLAGQPAAIFFGGPVALVTPGAFSSPQKWDKPWKALRHLERAVAWERQTWRVYCWHKAYLPLALTKVRYGGISRHGGGRKRLPLLTRSGHERAILL